MARAIAAEFDLVEHRASDLNPETHDKFCLILVDLQYNTPQRSSVLQGATRINADDVKYKYSSNA